MFIEMKEKLKEIAISPVIFVGAGLSRRYIDLPDWVGLLEKSSHSISVNFEKIKQKYTDSKNNVNCIAIATELDDLYFESLDEEHIEIGKNKGYYYKKRIADIIRDLWDLKKSELNTKELMALKNISPSAIITTNYDPLLETIFENYQVHIGQQSLLSNVVDGVGDIYKIHGCISKPESIIINADDYDSFRDSEIYLNAKLLTLFLEYPIIFMGYSVSDPNVKSILSTIIKMLPIEKVKELNNRIWFLNRSKDGNESAEVTRINLDNSLYMDINAYYLNDFTLFYEAVSDIENKRLPVKFLKYLKNNIYKLAASQKYDPKKLDVNIVELEKVGDFSKLTNIAGLSFSTKTVKMDLLEADDICQAFINDDLSKFETISVINYQAQNTTQVPVFWAAVHLDKVELANHINKLHKKRLTDRFNKKEQKDYVIHIGGENRNYIFDYTGLIKFDSVQQYIDAYIERYNDVNHNAISEKQKEPVLRRLLLDFLINRTDEIIKNDEIIEVCSKGLMGCITHLTPEFIISKKEKVMQLIQKINKFNDEGGYRKMLCYVDYCLYHDSLADAISLIDCEMEDGGETREQVVLSH